MPWRKRATEEFTILAETTALDLAVLKAEVKKQVPFLPLNKVPEPKSGTAVAVIGSPLARRQGPLAAGTISARRSDEGGERLEISAPISNDAAGTPVVDANGDVVGVVTSARGQGATAASVVWTSSALHSLLTQTKPGAIGHWAAATTESPSPSPQPSVRATAANRKSKLTYNPPPKYPAEARFSRVSGSGRFRITFSADGEAREVQVIESTGKSVLDQAATASLRQWKSESGHEWSVVVPITFQP